MGNTNSTALSHGGGSDAPPIGYTTPSFPSLYLPRWTFYNISVNLGSSSSNSVSFPVVQDSNDVGSDGIVSHWLYYAVDIWHFTLYWHLIFHAIIFGLPAIWFTVVALASPTSAVAVARPWSSRFERGGVDSDYREEEKSGKGEEEDGEVGKNGEVDEGRARAPSPELRSTIDINTMSESPEHPHFHPPTSDHHVQPQPLPSSLPSPDQRSDHPPPSLRKRASALHALFQNTPLTGSAPHHHLATPSGVDGDSQRGIKISLPHLVTSTSTATGTSNPLPKSKSKRNKLFFNPFTARSAANSQTPRDGKPRGMPDTVPLRLPPPFYLPFLPLIIFPLWAVASAVIMGTIIGFSLSAVYSTAGFQMSTWIPFLWAVMESSVLIMTSFSTWTTVL